MMSRGTGGVDLASFIKSQLLYTAWAVKRTKNNGFFNQGGNIELSRSVGHSVEPTVSWKLRSMLMGDHEGMDVQGKTDLLRRILLFIDHNLEENVEKELLSLFTSILSARQDPPGPPPQLSPSSLKFLEKNLHHHAPLVHWTIDQLLCIWSPVFSPTDSSLQDIYQNALKEILKPASIHSSSEAQRSSPPVKNPNFVNEEHLGVLLCILSRLNVTESKEMALTEWLNPSLVKSCAFEDVELAFYSRKDPKYYKTWHKFLDDILARRRAPDALEHALKITYAIFALRESSSHPWADELLLRTIKTRNHWLSDILSICHLLSLHNRLDLISKILQSESFPRFWVLILLKVLVEPSEVSASGLKSLLSNSELKLLNIEMFDRLEKTLQDQVEVLDWISRSSSSSTKPSPRAVLNLLRTSSILSVLRACVDLHETDHDVSHLLTDCPASKTTFRAYSVMLHHVRAILLCDNYNSEFERVSECFSQMEKHLNSLNPLAIRLETMENIFSMMFMRHEDFSGDTISDCGEDDDDPLDKKTWEKGNQTGFICNKYAIRETVHYLNRCLFVATSDLSRGQGDEGLEDKVSAMKKCLTEAVWRLELLTSSEFLKKQGLPDSGEQPGPDVGGRVINQGCRENFYRTNESSDENEKRSDVDASSESGSMGNCGFNQGGRRRRRCRNNWGRRGGRECSLNYMLATTETLVVRCLWKNDYAEAQRVIETLGMESSSLAGEIMFSRAIKGFREDIKKQMIFETKSDTPTRSKHSTINIIRQAVREGLHSSRKTSQLETFLASQEPNISLLCHSSANPHHLMTLTSLDLTLTSSHDYLTSENLAEVTKKHFESSEKLRNTRYFDLFQTIHQLLHETRPESSIIRIINDARSPLSVKDYKKRFRYWSDLENHLKPLEGTTKLLDQIANVSPNLKTDFSNLLSLCNNGDPYLHNLEAHLEILASISPQPETPANPSLLKNSLDFYIGYQIFTLNVDLQLLEKIANDLQINLVYSILVNCCPKLPYHNPTEPEVSSDRWGMLVLNRFKAPSPIPEMPTDPNQCVIDILSELLGLIKDLHSDASVLTHPMLVTLSRSQEVQKVLRKTEELSSVDLSHLSFGNHTLSFFLNLWNLLFLHSAINIWGHDPPHNHLRHTVSLRTISYEVGDLGLVTIFSLRSKLLGTLPADYGPCFESHVEELNEPAWQDLDLQQDPRTIFGMINEFEVSPVLNIYHPDSINEDLNAAVQGYLDFYTEGAGQKGGLSEVFQKIRDDSFADGAAGAVGSNYVYGIKLRYSRSDEGSGGIEGSGAPADDAWKTREISPNLLHYLENHCWLLCYLVQRIHEKSPSSNFGSRRTAVLESLLNSASTENLKLLFSGNKALAGLQNHLPVRRLWDILERLLSEKKLKESLQLLANLPDAFLLKTLEIQKLKDKILSEMIDNEDPNSPEILQYVYQIQDEQTLTQVILSKVKVWPVRTCEEALRHVLQHSHNKIPSHCRSYLNEILCRVMVFDKMLPYFKNQVEKSEQNWYNVVYRTEKTDPTKIVKSLIDAQQFELCLEWLEYQTASSDIHSLVSQDLFLGLLSNREDDFKHAQKLLSALPLGQSQKLCKGVIEKLQSTEALKFVVSYLLANSADKEKYKRGSLGVDLLAILDPKDRGHYVHLITEPLLLLEQLLMNCKFDNLKRILKTQTRQLKALGFTIDKFDKIVRFYARKSLDLRVATQRDQSDTSRLKDPPGQAPDFVMPLHAPTREEWIPNDKARECSCCRNVIFSMFNRRHHCRRCGRVVCGSCSNQRMMVAGYANSVRVRICNDCKKQTAQLQAVPSTSSSESFDCWKLTTDEGHNKTLREEFCFEYAPNISLCLAILNLHSDHEAYANFLQDRCDEMKRLLYPDTKGQINREIDHALIIKMIRSLLIAAKVKCARLGLNTGLTHCDRFLSQVDLIDTLVQSDCLSLLPRDDLNEHTFRRLRDLLTEKEQWILALDVSTKSGLDTQGVWAAWGKACLKVGYYERAREKFVHCLEKVSQEDFDDWVLLPHPSPKTNRSELKAIKSRPSKDPPLVAEILQILENSNSTEQYSKAQTTHAKNSTAQEIMNTLGNLKAISHGQYAVPKLTCSSKNIRYQESLYYLLMYGSCNSILEFFIRHDDLDKCLTYTLENEVDPEVFFNVAIIGCLKAGKLGKLCETMRSRDATLMTWKRYLIATCLYLERKQLMNTLYQFQLFMKDYVRAAMTCIKFYVTDATTYADLCTRTHFLTEAQKHLESELQVENFGKKRRKSVSSSLSGPSGSLTMEMDPSEIDKHVNTISRQMEIAKFLGNCEKEGRNVNDYLSKLSYMESEGLQPRSVPTLFGNQKERTHLAVLAILCGRDVEEGFGFAFRIMQDYYLSPQKVYSLVGHILALDKRVGSIEQLIKCCRSSGAPNSQVISDRVLAHCVKLLLDKSKAEASPSPKDQIDSLIRIINDVEMKIDSYIESKQLKAAYLLAVKHSRGQDIRKILREADRLGQGAIKSICTKWLQQAKK
ncbi:uncharacterized protein LOC107043630 [Diachasma alloeum]|uniref:uncharacterized protein LOC107043630 n=1 Tax=Diachasma alloeum TaxID=454923 RepID=UPI0007384AC4|nr:uncharacterized protein LOC107043630 [Diachasma alloeum]